LCCLYLHVAPLLRPGARRFEPSSSGCAGTATRATSELTRSSRLARRGWISANGRALVPASRRSSRVRRCPVQDSTRPRVCKIEQRLNVLFVYSDFMTTPSCPHCRSHQTRGTLKSDRGEYYWCDACGSAWHETLPEHGSGHSDPPRDSDSNRHRTHSPAGGSPAPGRGDPSWHDSDVQSAVISSSSKSRSGQLSPRESAGSLQWRIAGAGSRTPL